MTKSVGKKPGDVDRLSLRAGRGRGGGGARTQVSCAGARVALRAVVAIPKFTGYVDRTNISEAKAHIDEIQLAISNFSVQNKDALPDTLTEVDLAGLRDPWGNPYQYLNIATAPNRGRTRKDRNLVPINTDYDLYSLGEDGDSKAPLTARASHDDIIRANNGNFIGLGEDY